MDSMGENKYQNGKIYKIVDVGYNKCYIGSTCESLSQRMARHRKDFKRWQEGKRNSYSLFGIFDEFGLDNCRIELLEKYEAEDKETLRKQEGFYIKQLDCVNKMVAGRTRIQHYEDNKEKVLLQSKSYRENNKDKIKEYHEKHYQKNKDKNNECLMCVCGNYYTRTHKARHVKTKKHQNYLKQQSEENE